MGIDLQTKSNAELQTLRMPLKLVVPFVVMVLLSLVTRPNDAGVLDRFYAKMKTPTAEDPDEDRGRLEESYQDPSRLEHRKLFPGTSIEIQKPGLADVLGFFVCLAICFLFVGLAVWVTSIGS
jgi:SSS family solute:Na+ symporter